MAMKQTAIDDPARFAFGANWSRFLSVLDDDRVAEAETSLQTMLGVVDLKGKKFLDAGSGSGLFSLAARRLGAKVHAFDYDPQSVACTGELRRRYFPDDPDWNVETGSILDPAYVGRLGLHDIVYSWGVLHHTGAMWLAIEQAISLVNKGGTLFIAIYNDQGWKSHLWWFLKLFYNRLPRPLNTLYAYALGGAVHALNILKQTILLRPMLAVRPLLNYKKKRGMSVTHDLIDWMGGFPYEFARHEVLKAYMESRGFQLERSRPCTSLGCHELVFRAPSE